MDLAALRDLLAQERQALQIPDFEPLWSKASEQAWHLVMDVVRHLEANESETYGLYGSLDELRVAIFDVFDSDNPDARCMADVVEALKTAADQEWLVAAPIANLLPPSSVLRLGDVLALAPTESGDTNPVESREQLRGIFGEFIPAGEREHTDQANTPIDSRHTVSLISAENGTRHACEKRAHVKAGLLLATWTSLVRPKSEGAMPLWPVATDWLPQPFIHLHPRDRRLRPPDERPRSSGGSSLMYQPDENALYPIPPETQRQAPVRALEMAASHHCATALLSASWNLYLAARLPTDLQWLDRLVLMMRARDALCEDHADLTPRATSQRWKHLSEDLNLAEKLRERGFSKRDYASITGRAWQLRNIGVHSAEQALLALGYPTERERQIRSRATITGAELAPLRVREDTEPPYTAVLVALQHLWGDMLEHDFDDSRWEAHFSAH